VGHPGPAGGLASVSGKNIPHTRCDFPTTKSLMEARAALPLNEAAQQLREMGRER